MNLLSYTQDACGVGVITLNDPSSRNAMTEEMAEEFSALVSTCRSASRSLRAIILTGAGASFSAGGSLQMLAEKQRFSGEENRLRMVGFYNAFLGIRDLHVPLIAAINGHAIGAGLCLACACDIRIASPNAKLGVTFAKLGLHPGMGATYFLPSIVGISIATDLLITGRTLSADEAFRVGLLSRVTGESDLLTTAHSIAQDICRCGPEAIRQVLSGLRQGPRSLSESLEREALCQSISYAGSEFNEGLSAIREKREPRFS
jgi:enoyl-CoA hydratase/carnithine racemase